MKRPVDWRSLRAVVLQSDDWGFPGWSTAPDDRPRVEESVEHYATSTLESAADVSAIAEIFARITGRDGLPALLQPNYVTLSPDFSLVTPGDAPPLERFPRYAAPWERPGLREAVDTAIERGVWWPEHHAALHCDLDRFRARAVRGIASSLHAWGRGRWEVEDPDGRAEYAGSVASIEDGVDAFVEAFGRIPVSTAPPGYVLPVEARTILRRVGLDLVQAPGRARWQGRRPPLPARVAVRLARVVTGDGVQRTADFEPAQGVTASAVIARCLRDWHRGRPAVVSTHRANYVNWNADIAGSGRDELARLLVGLEGATFLTDGELVQLARDGVSVGRRGGTLVVRNTTGRPARAVFERARLARLGVEGELATDVDVGETRIPVGEV